MARETRRGRVSRRAINDGSSLLSLLLPSTFVFSPFPFPQLHLFFSSFRCFVIPLWLWSIPTLTYIHTHTCIYVNTQPLFFHTLSFLPHGHRALCISYTYDHVAICLHPDDPYTILCNLRPNYKPPSSFLLPPPFSHTLTHAPPPPSHLYSRLSRLYFLLLIVCLFDCLSAVLPTLARPENNRACLSPLPPPFPLSLPFPFKDIRAFMQSSLEKPSFKK